MSEEDFRAVYRGGMWWVERFHDGAWRIWAGPYKYRAHAEKRIERAWEWDTPKEQKQ